MKVTDFATNAALLCALDRGYTSYAFNKSARRHFDWFLPDTDHRFSIHHFVNAPKGELSYRVDNQSTSSIAQAIAWLKETAEPLPERCGEARGGGGRTCYLPHGHKGSHYFECGK